MGACCENGCGGEKLDVMRVKQASEEKYYAKRDFAYRHDVPVKVKKLDDRATIPQYQKEGDAAFDFHALIDNDLGYIVVDPKSQVIVRTGISCTIPSGYEIQTVQEQ